MKMASSSGNSSGSDDLQQQRKRKRMLSNRESARRSRMRKQKHLDELTAEVAQISNENDVILSNINVSRQQYVKVEAENSVLRAQMMELSQRLQSLNDILNQTATAAAGSCMLEADDFQFGDGFLNSSWNLMATSEIMFGYY